MLLGCFKLDRKFGSGVAVPTNLARVVTGLPRKSFYRYLSLLENVTLVKWERGALNYKTRKRVEGRIVCDALGEVNHAKALRLGLRALEAPEERESSD